VKSFAKGIKTLLVRKGKYTIFLFTSQWIYKELRILFVPTTFTKTYTVLYNVLGPIAIDFTFIHCTYIFNVNEEISYLMVHIPIII